MQWHAPISGHPVTESIASNTEKGVHKIPEFKSAFTLAESYAQSVQPQTGFAENNAGLSISFIFLLLTFLRRM